MRLALTTVLALIAFSANSVLCRLALSGGHIDAVTFSSVRLVGGSVALLLIGGWPRRRIPWAGKWTAAVFLFLYAVPFALAYNRLSAGTGALILFGSVQVTMMIAALRGGERPHLSQWLGLGTALGGLLYLIGPGLARPPLPAATLMAVAGACWGTYTLRGRTSTDPLADTTRNFVKTVPLVLIVGLLALPQLHADRTGIALAAASGVVASGLGYVVWYSALASLTATRAAVAQLAVPVLSAIGGVIFLNEAVTTRLAVSSAMVLGGIALAVLVKDRARRSTPLASP